MKPRLGYLPTQTNFPFGGLDTTEPSTSLAPGFSPNLGNVSVIDGNLTHRFGYTALGTTLSGMVLALIPFQDGAGVNSLVAVTSTKQYVYDSSGNTWVNITKNSGGLTGGGSDVNLTGDETNVISYVSATGTDTGRVLIITNGKDMPRMWDGNHSHMFVDVAFNYPNLVTCKALAYMNDTLIMGNITDTGGSAPQLIAWANAGQVNEWLAGTSGEETAYDATGAILTMRPLAGSMVIYSENSVHIMSFVGGTAVFTFQKMLDDTRMTSPRAVVELGPFHVFMGQDNLQLFDGSTYMRSVATRVHTTYRDTLDFGNLHKTFAFLDRAKRRAFFGVPNKISQQIDIYVLEYDVANLASWKWVIHNFDNNPSAMGFWIREDTLQWNSSLIATLQWKDYTGTWASASATKGFPSRVFGDLSGNVYVAGDTLSSDNGQVFASWWDSPDYTLPQEYQSEYGRFLEIEVELKGDTVDVYYSTDEGQNYQTAQLGITLTSSWAMYKIPIDVVSRKLRVSVQNTQNGTTWSMRFLRVWFTPSGPY